MIDFVLQSLNKKIIQLKLAEDAYRKNTIAITKEKKAIEILQQAKAVIIQVGESTQQEIKHYIEETVTLALQSVYGEDYEFIIEFNYTKREQFEIYFYVVHLGIKLEPRKDTCGGGVIDICSFALRMVCLTLEQPNIASVLILDEPFKNVSAMFIPAVGQMVVDVADLLNLQIIMVTHVDGFIETANNIIYV
jgi:DNA repair exonuclease SbcCD ATPase subunit